jgi:hypothetical protein
MSQFAGVPFRVIPDGNLYPQPEKEGDTGLARYKCKAWFASAADEAAMRAKLTVVTWKRPRGALVANGHIDAGYGTGSLTIPRYGGTTAGHTAILERMSGGKGYGKTANDEFTADLEFVITSATV